MTFLKLQDGSLMVFAPLHYDSAMRATLQKLGDVQHIVVRLLRWCWCCCSCCAGNKKMTRSL